ncbi:MAG: hypothetical protein IPM47_14430 [Sphingobacteriales bacterium]|nr:MAG: hypothetical protein IPM47_14430 [Sphingobacteriales bacterium]
MATSKFIPSSNEDKVVWLQNFASKLHLYKLKYNLTDDEIDDMVASALFFTFVVNYHKQVDEYKINITAYRDELSYGFEHFGVTALIPVITFYFDEEVEETLPPPAVPNGIFKRASAIAQKIKTATNFAIADGQNLGIIAEHSDTDYNTVKVEFILRLVAGGHPEVVWKKLGMDAVEIHVLRPGFENFVLLAVDQFPNFIDNHPLPEAGRAEVWSYRLIYRKKDGRVGLWSDIVSITVTGI